MSSHALYPEARNQYSPVGLPPHPPFVLKLTKIKAEVERMGHLQNPHPPLHYFTNMTSHSIREILHIAYLFTKSDFKTIMIPIVCPSYSSCIIHTLNTFTDNILSSLVHKSLVGSTSLSDNLAMAATLGVLRFESIYEYVRLPCVLLLRY